MDDRHSIEFWNIPVTSAALWPDVLSDEEKVRAARYRVQPARDAFVTARSALRILAGRYLDRDPRSLQFEVSAFGKPALPGTTLGFNVSHSASMAVLGFAWDLDELGVDVEHLERKRENSGVAKRFFHREEVLDIASAPDPLEAFFRCWTRKEAYIKAVGQGLSIPLDSFRVSVQRDRPPALLNLPGWTLHSWTPAEGYLAAAAYPGPARTISFHRLS